MILELIVSQFFSFSLSVAPSLAIFSVCSVLFHSHPSPHLHFTWQNHTCLAKDERWQRQNLAQTRGSVGSLGQKRRDCCNKSAKTERQYGTVKRADNKMTCPKWKGGSCIIMTETRHMAKEGKNIFAGVCLEKDEKDKLKKNDNDKSACDIKENRSNTIKRTNESIHDTRAQKKMHAVRTKRLRNDKQRERRACRPHPTTEENQSRRRQETRVVQKRRQWQ